MTKDEALRWLRQHGAEDVYFGSLELDADRRVVNYGIVGGLRVVLWGNLWTNGRTAVLEFNFDPNGHFRDVTLEIWPFEFANRKAKS